MHELTEKIFNNYSYIDPRGKGTIENLIRDWLEEKAKELYLAIERDQSETEQCTALKVMQILGLNEVDGR